METQKSWYDVFVEELRSLDIKEKEVENVITLIDSVESSEENGTQAGVKKIEKAINKISLKDKNALILFEYFSKKEKMFKSMAGADDYLKRKFTRKLRVIQNRLDRNIPDGFGSYLKHLRGEKQYALNDVYNLTGISPSYLNRIEKGERKAPSFPIIEKLANVYEVPVDDLLAIAGIKPEGVVTSATTLEQLFYKNEFTVKGKELTTKQKDLIVELINSTVQAKWNEKTKVKESIEIMNIVSKLHDL